MAGRVSQLPYCCSASNWAVLTRARRDCQNSHQRLVFAQNGPLNCRSERHLTIARRQSVKTSSESPNGTANGDESMPVSADMAGRVVGTKEGSVPKRWVEDTEGEALDSRSPTCYVGQRKLGQSARGCCCPLPTAIRVRWSPKSLFLLGAAALRFDGSWRSGAGRTPILLSV